MKIALLNLPVDNNYGGHLQRYALVEVLRQLGCDVVHLNTRFPYERKSRKKQVKLAVKRFLRYFIFKITKKVEVPEIRYLSCYLNGDHITDYFYNRYVKHTKRIYDKKDLTRYLDFDMFLVGSDQVWRYKYTNHLYGIDTYFFDYLPQHMPRVAYGVSFGTKENEFDEGVVKRLGVYYNRFLKVSVREKDAIQKIDDYKWGGPNPVFVLDPTLLLSREDYIKIVKQGKTKPSSGNLFCYVLDKSEYVDGVISDKIKEKNYTPFEVLLGNDCSVEQWLRSFMDAEFVITDSYHGLLFSLIFNKPFYLCKNEKRGGVRFDNVLNLLEITGKEKEYDWEVINKRLNQGRAFSLDFLRNSIKDE